MKETTNETARVARSARAGRVDAGAGCWFDVGREWLNGGRMVTVQLSRPWTLDDRIGSGGYGQVYAAHSGTDESVIKLVPKDPGADRELLFVQVEGVRNVVPIAETGEYERFWVLRMPRAEKSLADHLLAAGRLPADEVAKVLVDITTALVDLDNVGIVHRDLKPGNVLLLNGVWRLADFGISRYAEATTSPDTRKLALSPPYAAPERWRERRATPRTDIYSLGAIAYELITGTRPFPGPDFREQHLNTNAIPLTDGPTYLRALVDECLYKAPEARPTAANVLARLERNMNAPQPSGGLARLAAANRSEVEKRSNIARAESEAQSEADRRAELFQVAARQFAQISATLLDAITDAAPSAVVNTLVDRQRSVGVQSGWSLRLGEATLDLEPLRPDAVSRPFDVVGSSAVRVTFPQSARGYSGRSHSLWFADAQQAEQYRFYETALMIMPMMSAQSPAQDPFAEPPGSMAANAALQPGMNTHQVAWPFTPLELGALDEFVDRWGNWFALAADGQLEHPSMMPERPTTGSWRQS